MVEEYIANHDCKTEETVPVLIKGKKHVLSVYRLPLDHLYYNIKNGRFKMEYLLLVQKNGGRDLDPENAKDGIKIKKTLLSLDPSETRRTMDDMRERGQWVPGVITHDGFVIDGNRRLAILDELSAKNEEFKYMKVGKLPKDIEPNDLWKIEAGLQLGKEQIVKYGPINELLKLREGRDAEISTEEIASTLYGFENDKEIKEKLELLDLIEDYLDKFLGKKNQYHLVKDRVEHFIDLMAILKITDQLIDDSELKTNVKIASYELIRKKIPHRELRKIREMIKQNSTAALEWITKIAEATIVRPTETEEPEPTLDEEVEDVIDEKDNGTKDEDEEEDVDEIKTMYENATDSLNVTKSKNDIPKLLTRALNNLDAIDYTNEDTNKDLTKDEAKDIILKILRHAKKLSSKIQE